MKRESWVSSFGRRFKSFFFETYIRANFSNFSKRFHRTETSNVGKSDGAFKKAFLHRTKTLSFIIILSPCKIFPAWWLATGSNRKYKWIQFASCNTATGRLSPPAFPLDAFLAGNSWNSPNFSRPSSDFSASSRGISPCLWNEYRIYKECNFFVYSYCVV